MLNNINGNRAAPPPFCLQCPMHLWHRTNTPWFASAALAAFVFIGAAHWASGQTLTSFLAGGGCATHPSALLNGNPLAPPSSCCCVLCVAKLGCHMGAACHEVGQGPNWCSFFILANYSTNELAVPLFIYTWWRQQLRGQRGGPKTPGVNAGKKKPQVKIAKIGNGKWPWAIVADAVAPRQWARGLGGPNNC